MSASCGYLISDKSFPVGQFAKLIGTILKNYQVINGYYDKEQGTLAAGQNSFFIFSNNQNSSDIAFEYADIHDTTNNRLIPDSSSEGYGANCRNCKENIDEDLYDVLNDLYEREFDTCVETDMTNLEISCSNCGHINKLADIKFDFETEIKNQYIQFVDIESDFNLDKVKEIGKLMNCDFKIIYERT
jgi:hypothetical protein